MRKENWPNALNKYLGEMGTPEFKYGECDCCTFAAGAVEAITGEDPMKEYRGRYKTLEGGQSVMKKVANTRNLYKVLIKKFGKPVHGARGQRGDIAFYEGNCGVIVGRYGVFLSEGGLSLVRISFIQRAFRVR